MDDFTEIQKEEWTEKQKEEWTKIEGKMGSKLTYDGNGWWHYNTKSGPKEIHETALKGL